MNKCPRCESRLLQEDNCIICGWAGPTREPSKADQRNTGARIRGRFVEVEGEKIYVHES